MSPRPLQTLLVSNNHPLEMTSERLGWLVPTDSGLPMAQLRAHYQEQGYLWLKGILDRTEVLAFRRHFFTSLQESGLLAPGSNPVEGIYAGGEIQKERLHTCFWELVRSSDFEAFCTTSRLWKFYEAFLGDRPYLHKRKILRHNLPNEQHCTGGHYDLVYLRAGTDRLCSSWIPIGDTPVEMGGLLYLEGSDAIGRTMEAEFSGRNTHLTPEERMSAYNKNMREDGWISTNLPDMARRFNTRWLVADYEAGDMVVHSPYMLHAAVNNCDIQGRIRLSCDIRYQRASDTIDQRWASDWASSDNL